MALLEHAKAELRTVFPDITKRDGDEMQKAICKDILDIVDLFSRQGHSGSSAAYAIPIIHKLLKYEPLSPLTGEDDEWNVVGEDRLQNKRCGRVFKTPSTGEVYDIEGKIFRQKDGLCFTSGDSFVPVEFPYTPKTEYVDVEQ